MLSSIVMLSLMNPETLMGKQWFWGWIWIRIDDFKSKFQDGGWKNSSANAKKFNYGKEDVNASYLFCWYWWAPFCCGGFEWWRFITLEKNHGFWVKSS
jgi:hypothetical protein